MWKSGLLLSLLIVDPVLAFAEDADAKDNFNDYRKIDELMEKGDFKEVKSQLKQLCVQHPTTRCDFGWGALYEELGPSYTTEMANAYQQFLEKTKGTKSPREKEQRVHAKNKLDDLKSILGNVRIWEKEKFKIDKEDRIILGPTTVWVSANDKHIIQFLGAKKVVMVSVSPGEERKVERPANPSPVTTEWLDPSVSTSNSAYPTSTYVIVNSTPMPASSSISGRKGESIAFLTTGLFFLTLGTVGTGICATRADLCGGGPTSSALTVLNPIFEIAPGVSLSILGIVGLARTSN